MLSQLASSKIFGCNQFQKSDKTRKLCENITGQNFYSSVS